MPMITFKQYLQEALAVATPGAKNHTGPGSDTQTHANKAKDARKSPQPRTDMQTKTNKPTPKAAPNSEMHVKDSENADKAEAQFKKSNVKYTKTTDKNGVKFQFKDGMTKARASRLAQSTMNKELED